MLFGLFAYDYTHVAHDINYMMTHGRSQLLHVEIIIHSCEATWQYHMPTPHSQFDHTKA
jgi:hypothetical protein